MSVAVRDEPSPFALAAALARLRSRSRGFLLGRLCLLCLRDLRFGRLRNLKSKYSVRKNLFLLNLNFIQLFIDQLIHVSLIGQTLAYERTLCPVYDLVIDTWFEDDFIEGVPCIHYITFTLYLASLNFSIL